MWAVSAHALQEFPLMRHISGDVMSHRRRWSIDDALQEILVVPENLVFELQEILVLERDLHRV